MGKYIFLSFNIHELGGGQTYLNTKVDYLKNKGYNVYVFSRGAKFIKVPYKNLQKYDMCSFCDLSYPPMEIKKSRINRILRKIRKIVQPNNEEIVIESCDDVSALWGEIIANDLKCKHFCFSLNERFKGKNKYYEDNIDFFKFKFRRNELAFINSDCIDLLFGDTYKNISKEQFVLAAYSNAVEDLENKVIDKIYKCNFNIAYIGRHSKAYVNKILNDIALFGGKYGEKTIGLTLVGDSIFYKNEIIDMFKNLKNVNVFFTGVLIPIPKNIFSKFDVIIAGAGCGLISFQYSRYVIIPDPVNCMCNGLLGFDTISSLYAENVMKQTTYIDSLENVLIKKIYDELDRKKIILEDSSFYFNKHSEFINSSNKKEYYDINKFCEMKKRFKIYIKCMVLDHLFILNPILNKIKKYKRGNVNDKCN